MDRLEFFMMACEDGIMPVFDNAIEPDVLDEITVLAAEVTVQDMSEELVCADLGITGVALTNTFVRMVLS